MRGYDRSTYEDLDEYEEEGPEEEFEEEEEYEEEEPPKPTEEELEYLELRKRLKESFRKRIKKEGGSVHTNSQDRRNKLPYDNYGSFFGPSQPVIAQRVIQESKSLLETQHLTSRVSNSHVSNKKSSTSTSAGPKPGVHNRPLKVANELKTKAQKLRDTRDYSFLLSDDAELPVPTKEPPRAPPRTTSVPNSEVHSAQSSVKNKQPLSNIGRQVLSIRDERRPISTDGQMQHKTGSHKLASTKKSNLTSSVSKRQLGSNNGNGPGRPVVQKILSSKMPVTTTERRAPAPTMKNSMQTGPKPSSSKLHPSMPRQHSQQKKDFREPSRDKLKPKQPMAYSKPQITKPSKKISSHPVQERPQKKKPVRQYSDNEDDDEGGKAISMIRKMFGYNPNKFSGYDDDDSDMEANFDDILQEEKRSSLIARREDEEELRKIEEEERRERLRKIEKKRKMSQR